MTLQTEDEQLQLLEQDPSCFKDFVHPTATVRLFAIECDPLNIWYIPDATVEEKRLAISLSDVAFDYIRNQTLKDLWFDLKTWENPFTKVGWQKASWQKD